MLLVITTTSCLGAQQKVDLGNNAALRYWSAFAQMQDFGMTDQQAKETNLILEGTAPYDDSKYKDLLEKNRGALNTMTRGVTISKCDWGLDYQLGPATPIEYVRKALALGRLNILYSFHLLITGDQDGAVRTLAAGLHFSRDVANDGTLFATLAAKSLAVEHLRAIAFVMHMHQLSAAQRDILRDGLTPFGQDGLDWQAAMRRELGLLSPSSVPSLDGQAVSALKRITPAYLKIFDNPGALPELQQEIANAPQSVRDIIPNPKRVLEERQTLSSKLRETRSILQ